MRIHAQFHIVQETPNLVLIRDDGPWNLYPTITNDADWVVRQLAERLQDRMLLYIDSDGNMDQLRVKNGFFAGFAPGPRSDYA